MALGTTGPDPRSSPFTTLPFSISSSTGSPFFLCFLFLMDLFYFLHFWTLCLVSEKMRKGFWFIIFVGVGFDWKREFQPDPAKCKS